MKSILFLGAAEFQIAPIKYAIDSGYKVLTCDNKPDNPGHKLAHKKFNISTLDYDKIIKAIKPYKVDGILSYASDVSSFSASKIAEFLKINGHKPNVINTLTNKLKFRDFLLKNNIQSQKFFQIKKNHFIEIKLILSTYKNKKWILKPSDSSGAKGVSMINQEKKIGEIKRLVKYALENSSSKELIIEEFIERKGNQVCGDGYYKNREIKYIEFGDGWSYHMQKENNYTPYAESFPSMHQNVDLERLKKHLANILHKIGFKEGPFNHDSIIMNDGTPFVIEIGPRCGGNFIPDAIKYLSGFDFAEHSVEHSLGNSLPIKKNYLKRYKYIANVMLHSKKKMIFKGMEIHKSISKNILEKNIYISYGENIEKFNNSTSYYGNIIFHTNIKEELFMILKNPNNFFKPSI